MKHLIISLFALLILLTAWTLYANTNTETEIQLNSYSGIYKHENGRHYLETKDARLMLLLAPPAALDSLGIDLNDGDDLVVNAIPQKAAYLVSTIQIGESMFRLRSDDYSTNSYSELATVNVAPAKCIGCKMCITPCPVGAISMVKGKAYIDPAKCVSCGICIDGNGKFRGCPVRAISK